MVCGAKQEVEQGLITNYLCSQWYIFIGFIKTQIVYKDWILLILSYYVIVCDYNIMTVPANTNQISKYQIS